MSHFNRGISLPNPILIDHEILAANVGNEVAVGVLDQHFDRHNLSGRVEGDLCLLFTLFILEQRGGRSIRYMKLGTGLASPER